MKFIKYLLSAILLSAIMLTANVVTGAVDNDDKVIVAYGDSITASGAWFAESNNEYGIKIVNMGVGGDNSKTGLERLSAVKNKNPDIVLVSFGMNDSSADMQKHVPVDDYKKNITKMITELKGIGAKVIFVIENPIVETLYYTRHDKTVFEPLGGASAYYFEYVKAAREVCDKCGVPYIDMYAVITATGKTASYSADGVHPNASGYALYSKELVKALRFIDNGDADGNGSIDSSDYIATRLHILGVQDLESRKKYADVNADGVINSTDYIAIRLHILGITSLSGRQQ